MFNEQGAGSIDSNESKISSLKEAALASYRKFVDKGVDNPDDLDLNDSEVKAAHDLYYQWQTEIDNDSKNNPDNSTRNEIEKDMFYLEAGFRDPLYIDEVGSWLAEAGLDDGEIYNRLSSYRKS